MCNTNPRNALFALVVLLGGTAAMGQPQDQAPPDRPNRQTKAQASAPVTQDDLAALRREIQMIHRELMQIQASLREGGAPRPDDKAQAPQADRAARRGPDAGCQDAPPNPQDRPQARTARSRAPQADQARPNGRGGPEMECGAPAAPAPMAPPRLHAARHDRFDAGAGPRGPLDDRQGPPPPPPMMDRGRDNGPEMAPFGPRGPRMHRRENGDGICGPRMDRSSQDGAPDRKMGRQGPPGGPEEPMMGRQGPWDNGPEPRMERRPDGDGARGPARHGRGCRPAVDDEDGPQE